MAEMVGRMQAPRLAIVAVVCFMVAGLDCAPGTTANIQQIFIGRCLQYQEISRGKIIEPRKLDCIHLWSVFEKAWVHKDPASLRQTDYEEFLQSARQTNIPGNKILLWSGTYVISHEYSNDGSRYVSLEDSLIGYLVNGLTWCGMVCDACDGINHVECPNFTDLPMDASQAFWGGASSTFARSAEGVVKLIVSGTNPGRPAYSRSSFFAKFELPSMSKDTQLQVILANDLDKTPLEHCSTGSLLELQQDVENRGLSYTCVENPPDILHLMCVGNQSASKCLLGDKANRKLPLSKLLKQTVNKA